MDDPFDLDDAPVVAQPPKKRSLFSKKAIEKAAEHQEAVELFSRAKEVHPQILAEEERRRQKRLTKLERKRSSMSADTKEITPPEEKRRRLGEKAKPQDGYSSDESRSPHAGLSPRAHRRSSHSSPASQRSRKDSSSHKPHTSPHSLSARYSKEVATGKQPAPRARQSTGCITLSDSEDESPTKSLPVRAPVRQPISLSDSDDEDIPQHQRATKPIVVEEDNQFSDEEYPELVAAAKERARLKAEEAAKSAKAFQGQNHAAKSQDFDDIFELGPGSGDSDPIVEIFISSMIEGTTALRVKRKISQNLAPVRAAWCKKQETDGHPLGSQMKDVVFLTWKHHRLFDSSTCNGLGLKVNELGSLASTGDGLGEDGRVHLEAWTPDAFEVFQKRQALKKQKEQQEDADDGEEQHNEPTVQKIRLIFKSRDLPDYKLMVKPSTTVEKMVDAFRGGNKIPDDKIITMHFDGEILDDADTVGDAELGDLDTLEMHIK